jgi:uncharacterized phiE125 gp8 family phage protein
MGLTLLEAPGAEPLALAEAKAHCKVDADITDDDALIAALIIAARRQAEHLTGRALVTQRWRLSLVRFPAASLELPRPPLQSIESISYLDQDGARQALAASDYEVITDELFGRALPAYGKHWPACRAAPGSVLVEYTAGYGLAAAVPQDIRHWMLLAIGTWYAQREASATSAPDALPRAFWDALLDPYHIVRVV